MKKILSLVAIAAMMLTMAGCAVNANTGAITVTNSTTNAAKNVKVGSVNIGYVAAGEVKTVYFFKDEAAAQVSGDGLSATGGQAGTIEIKKNYAYAMNIRTYIDGDHFSMRGYKLGYDASNPAADDVILMK